MIADSFDLRTFANMEAALERTCEILSIGVDEHTIRHHIATRILKCAEQGERTLGGLTVAGRVAATELRSTHGR